MAVQDRLDDILQARSLPDDLVAPGYLPAKRLGRLVRNPDFRQKAACIKLREHAGVDRIGLDLRMSDDANLLGVRDHDLLDVRRDHRRDRRRVAGYDLRQIVPIRKGGSGSLVDEVMLPAADAASGGWRSSGV